MYASPKTLTAGTPNPRPAGRRGKHLLAFLDRLERRAGAVADAHGRLRVLADLRAARGWLDRGRLDVARSLACRAWGTLDDLDGGRFALRVTVEHEDGRRARHVHTPRRAAKPSKARRTPAQRRTRPARERASRRAATPPARRTPERDDGSGDGSPTPDADDGEPPSDPPRRVLRHLTPRPTDSADAVRVKGGRP